MDRIDILLIIILIAVILRGFRAGIIQLALSTVGFIVGLFAGSWLSSELLSGFSSLLSKTLLTILIELTAASILSILGEMIAQKLPIKSLKFHLGAVNNAVGAIFEVCAVFFIIWIITPSISNIRTYNLGFYFQHSKIVRAIDNILPNPPDYISILKSIIAPNGFPVVFTGLEPSHTTISPNNTVNRTLIVADEKSVVQIDGYGCGGIVEGSGFVIDNDLVVTNAHVVAGINNPKVIDSVGSYNATPIYFDPNMDLAVLKAGKLNLPSLTLSNENLLSGNSAATLGYPGGGPLVINSAVIIDQVDATGQNIYNQGQVERNIYEMQSNVQPGNSGGPLVNAYGYVAGVVFAKSVSQPDVGYALSIRQLTPAINHAIANQNPVSDGQCSTT